MHRWCLLNLTVQGFSLNLTVREVSNKHCLLTFFIKYCANFQQFCTNGPWVTRYQDCSNNIDLSKNMANRGAGPVFPMCI